MTARDEARAKFFQALEEFDAGRLESAEALLREADSLAPDTVPVVTNLAAVLLARGNAAAARPLAERGRALDPANNEATIILGSCLNHGGEHRQAIAVFDEALRRDGADAEAWLGRSSALAGLEMRVEAIAAADQALKLKPGLVQAWVTRGNLCADLKRYSEAIAAFRTALTFDPEAALVRGTLLHCRMQICDWTGIEEEWQQLLGEVRADRPAARPFEILAIPSTADDQLRCARAYLKSEAGAAVPVPAPPTGPRVAGRIRIAYLSADFHEHATSHLMAGMLERHDRERFETFAFSYGPDTDDPMQQRVAAAVDHFLQVRTKSHSEIADLIREHRIDIAVDLKGFTGDNRLTVLDSRPAPVQVSFLGYPGTTGHPQIDYVIADRTVIPEDQRQHYSEKVVYLPDTYQPNDRDRPRHFVGPPPGIADAFVFCCLNAPFKITPDMFDVWMRILRRVAGSVLWLFAGDQTVLDNLRREATRRGVDAKRLVFAGPDTHARHLARYGHAALFLDTLHYNAHTTCSDALWRGLPVLTCAGETFASRVAASLVTAAGLPELVVTSLADYEETAVRLATGPIELARLKDRLGDAIDRGPLFDPDRFVRNLEAAYAEMLARHERGEAPASFAADAFA